jgi:hypothetical protein
LIETSVGFKYIAAEMLKGGVLLGFEESGGIGFPGYIPERDGILAGMMLLELLATERKSINKLIAGLDSSFGPHRYARIDAHFPLEKRAPLMQLCRTDPPMKLLRSPLAEVKASGRLVAHAPGIRNGAHPADLCRGQDRCRRPLTAQARRWIDQAGLNSCQASSALVERIPFFFARYAGIFSRLTL